MTTITTASLWVSIALPSGAHVAHYREANGAIRAYVINSPTGEFTPEQYREYQEIIGKQSRLEREVEAFCDPRDYLAGRRLGLLLREAEAERQADKAECRHVYAPCDPVCIHCGAKLPMPAGRVYNAFGSMVPCPVCDGYGAVSEQEGDHVIRVDCPDCKGQGRTA